MDEIRIESSAAPGRRHSSAGALTPGVMAIALAVAVAVAAVVAWYVFSPVEDSGEVESARENATPASEPAAPAPRFPLPPTMPDRSPPGDLTPLPPLDDSDSYFELELSEVFGNGITELLVDQALVEKFVATIDNLPRAMVAERIRPIGAIPGPFAVDGQDASGEYTINPASYDRYDLLVTMLARADRDALVDVYRRFYPLFQEAYVNLGYPNRYFNDRVVEVIDHLLATPDVDEPVRLVRPHVLYEYEDPDLEALSAGQKLLIRIGAEHRVRVLQFLEEIRERIVQGAGELQ